MIPPRENILTLAGILAGFFVLAWALDSSPSEADTHAAQEARQELRRDLAAARACPPGHAVHWGGDRQMECLREVAP